MRYRIKLKAAESSNLRLQESQNEPSPCNCESHWGLEIKDHPCYGLGFAANDLILM